VRNQCSHAGSGRCRCSQRPSAELVECYLSCMPHIVCVWLNIGSSLCVLYLTGFQDEWAVPI
jgi:hypothetical protein